MQRTNGARASDTAASRLRGRVAEKGIEIRTCERGVDLGSGQTLGVDRLFGSRTNCVEQEQSVCSQPSPAAHELLQYVLPS